MLHFRLDGRHSYHIYHWPEHFRVSIQLAALMFARWLWTYTNRVVVQGCACHMEFSFCFSFFVLFQFWHLVLGCKCKQKRMGRHQFGLYQFKLLMSLSMQATTTWMSGLLQVSIIKFRKPSLHHEWGFLIHDLLPSNKQSDLKNGPEIVHWVCLEFRVEPKWNHMHPAK